MTTAAANLYQRRAASAPFSAAPKLEKAQKSSGFRARSTYGLGIKDRVLIDPCCGSGVFVLKMVDRIVADKDSENICESDRVKLLDELQHRVIGIDINPLSALTSRVNYFLAISRFIHPGDNVEIPIYVGDSAVMPKRVTLGKTECYQYVIETTFAENGENKEIEATLPVSFVENDTFLQTMDNIQTYVKSDNADVLNDFLIDSIGPVATDPEIQTAVRSFAETLTELHRNNWDGIWVRIVSNFMLIARISSRDIIVGNPPWVKWEYLPEHYAKKLKDACFERDMFSGQSYMGAISLNICAAIAIMTASAWLSQDGVLAFLMPRNLLTQDSYEGFRNFKLAAPRAKERLFLQYVEQWPTNGLFGEGSVEPCATFYYQSKRIDYSAGVSVSSYTKLRGKDLHSSNRWNAASKNFSIKNDLAVQLDSRRTGFTIVPNDDSKLITNLKLIVGTSDYKGRTGVEFVPEEVTLIKPVAQSSKEGQWAFKGMKMKRSIHKVSTDEEFTLETKFVRPLIKGPSISDFFIEDTGEYCLFPYEEPGTYCVSLADMMASAPLTAKYLLSKRDLFNRQSERSKSLTRGDEFYALSKVGTYTYGKHMVVLRDNVRMCAAVVKARTTPWGEGIMPIPAKHAALISTHIDGTSISEDEAYYLAGIFNTPVVRAWYKSTYSNRSYSIKFNFKIPKYNDDDPNFSQISQLSRIAHEVASGDSDSKQISKIERAIEQRYLLICQDIQ